MLKKIEKSWRKIFQKILIKFKEKILKSIVGKFRGNGNEVLWKILKFEEYLCKENVVKFGRNCVKNFKKFRKVIKKFLINCVKVLKMGLGITSEGFEK